MSKLEILIVKLIISIINHILAIFKNFLWTKRNDADYKNICIYKIGNIGDILCAIPAMYKIRNQFPDAKITLLTSPGNRNSFGANMILQYANWIDEIDTYYSEDIKGLKKIIEFLRVQRAKCYDYLIQLPAEKTSIMIQFRNLFFAKAMGVKYADGFYISTIKLFKKAQLKIIYPNEVERTINGLPFKNDIPVQFPLYVSISDKEYVDNIIREYGICDIDKIMIISHYGKTKANLWPYENFREIAQRWINRGGKVIIIGDSKQFDSAFYIIKDLKNAYNFCGKTTILQSMYLLTKATFLITIDTGTAHMASAMDVECITLSSAYYFKGKWNAYGTKNKVFRKDLKCSPCLKKECLYGDNRCMKAISVDEVWDYIQNKFL
jgi:ADP-heptose:LPS heptosyltransferase